MIRLPDEEEQRKPCPFAQSANTLNGCCDANGDSTYARGQTPARSKALALPDVGNLLARGGTTPVYQTWFVSSRVVLLIFTCCSLWWDAFSSRTNLRMPTWWNIPRYLDMQLVSLFAWMIVCVPSSKLLEVIARTCLEWKLADGAREEDVFGLQHGRDSCSISGLNQSWFRPQRWNGSIWEERQHRPHFTSAQLHSL